MASVWYVGTSAERRISPMDWARSGIAGPEVIWDQSNGYSLPHGDFTPQQLATLRRDSSFLTDQADGPREGSAAHLDPTARVTRRQMDEAIAKALSQFNPANPGGPGAPTPSFSHVQTTAAATWTINHNLGKYPAGVEIIIQDESVDTDVMHPSENQIVLIFPMPTTGRVELI